MKYFNRLAVVAMTVAFLAMTPQAVEAQQLKIGVADLAQLRTQAPQAEDASRVLEQEFATRQRDLVAEQRAVTELQERLQREGDVLADADEAARLERELRGRQRDLQRNIAQYEEDLNVRRNEELGKLQRLIFAEIQAFAREGRYDLVLVDGVIHASDQIDVTEQILQRLQARAGGSGR